MLDRLVARHHAPVHRQILRRDLRHALLDRGEVLGRERPLVGEIVVEAVLDHRADGDLGVGEQFLHRVRQQVRGRVADDLEPLRIPVGDDADARRRDRPDAEVSTEYCRRPCPPGPPWRAQARCSRQCPPPTRAGRSASGLPSGRVITGIVLNHTKRAGPPGPVACFKEMVRASGIEPLTPTMSR